MLKIKFESFRNKITFIEKGITFVENIALYFASFILICMTLLISIDTLCRYFLHKPIIGVLEVTEFIFMVIIVFFGLGFTSREKGHIRVDFLSHYLPKRLQKINEFIFNIITLCFFIIIGLQAWKQTLNAMRINQLSAGAVEFPMAPAFLIVVFGCLILCLRLGFDTLKLLLNEKMGD